MDGGFDRAVGGSGAEGGGTSEADDGPGGTNDAGGGVNLTTLVVGGDGCVGEGGGGNMPVGDAFVGTAFVEPVPLNNEGARGGRYGWGGCGIASDGGGSGGGAKPGGYRFTWVGGGAAGIAASGARGGAPGPMPTGPGPGPGTIIRSPHCGQFVGWPASPSGTRSVARHNRHWSETDMTQSPNPLYR